MAHGREDREDTREPPVSGRSDGTTAPERSPASSEPGPTDTLEFGSGSGYPTPTPPLTPTDPAMPPAAPTAPMTPTPPASGSSAPVPPMTPTPPMMTGETDATLVPGRLLFGKYLLLRKLGEGGMGEVWLVRHHDLDVERALKLIVASVAFNKEVRARFRREAWVMARFSHPNAVAVHDAVIRPGGNAAYIEMEYVRGQSLNKVLKPGVPMPLDWVARIVAQLCAVLQVAHEQGIVHRDLKPSNLMLLDGQPPGQEHLKVLDFGIAKILGEQHEQETLVTRPGMSVGTPQYMSPEQIVANPGEVDARSDIYSVGLILYEMLTGHRPFASTLHKLIYDHLETPPPPFAAKRPDPRVPPEVERLVLRCLEKDPARRPQSARELAEAFRKAAGLPDPSVVVAPARPLRRAIVAVLALAVILALGAVALWPRPPSLALRAVPQGLTLRAGETGTVTLVLTRQRVNGPVTIRAEGVPDGITIAPNPVKSNDDSAQIRVAADLSLERNIAPQYLLILRAEADRYRAEVSFRLDIEPALIALPSNCVADPGATLKRVGDRVYPDRIERAFPDGTRVPFRLITPKPRTDEPAPFYIMETKVWNGLFAKFAREDPDTVKGSGVWQPIAAGKLPEGWNERLPALDMTPEQAHRCAVWLGGKLPTIDQWDKAAGLFDRGDRAGPFEGPWAPRDKTEIAVDREAEGPLPVGSASRDKSPFGCRDMAGNGLEWTRSLTDTTIKFPPPPDTTAYIILRGRRFSDPKPLRYDEIRDEMKGEAGTLRSSDPQIGFRVVIELDVR
jgi:eukaryotic-like serine/threonine-protein kinase